MSTELKNLTDKELSDLKEKTEFAISKYKNLQLAKKITLNSCYGAQGTEYFRYYDVRIAEAVTLTGQLIIRWLEKDVNKAINKLCNTTDVDYIIAVDTDSLYVDFASLVKTIGLAGADRQTVTDRLDSISERIIVPVIDKSCQDLALYLNMHTQSLKMKRETIADKTIWTAKKKYIVNQLDKEGVRFASPKLKMSGIEAIRSSTPAICKDKLKEAIELVINGTEDDVINFIKTFKKEFVSVKPETVAFPRSVTDLRKYADKNSIFKKGCPQHVRASLMYNHMILSNKLDKKYNLIHDGDKIKYLYLKEPNHTHQDVMAFVDVLPEEFGLTKFVDFETQFQKSFVDPLNIILNAIGWHSEKKANLSAFFE